MEPCSQTHRIDRIEKDIDQLQKHDREHSTSIGDLKEQQAEQRVYVKQILETLSEVKQLIKDKRQTDAEQTHDRRVTDTLISKDKDWMELVKYIVGGTLLALAGWMAAMQFGG